MRNPTSRERATARLITRSTAYAVTISSVYALIHGFFVNLETIFVGRPMPPAYGLADVLSGLFSLMAMLAAAVALVVVAARWLIWALTNDPVDPKPGPADDWEDDR